MLFQHILQQKKQHNKFKSEQSRYFYWLMLKVCFYREEKKGYGSDKSGKRIVADVIKSAQV